MVLTIQSLVSNAGRQQELCVGYVILTEIENFIVLHLWVLEIREKGLMHLSLIE